MDKREQLKYLQLKYEQLKQQYLHELIEGHSLLIIKDLSFVLHTLTLEIEMLEKELNEIQPAEFANVLLK